VASSDRLNGDGGGCFHLDDADLAAADVAQQADQRGHVEDVLLDLPDRFQHDRERRAMPGGGGSSVSGA
jgi:hypothetical protein